MGAYLQRIYLARNLRDLQWAQGLALFVAGYSLLLLLVVLLDKLFSTASGGVTPSLIAMNGLTSNLTWQRIGLVFAAAVIWNIAVAAAVRYIARQAMAVAREALVQTDMLKRVLTWEEFSQFQRRTLDQSLRGLPLQQPARPDTYALGRLDDMLETFTQWCKSYPLPAAPPLVLWLKWSAAALLLLGIGMFCDGIVRNMNAWNPGLALGVLAFQLALAVRQGLRCGRRLAVLDFLYCEDPGRSYTARDVAQAFRSWREHRPWYALRLKR